MRYRWFTVYLYCVRVCVCVCVCICRARRGISGGRSEWWRKMGQYHSASQYCFCCRCWYYCRDRKLCQAGIRSSLERPYRQYSVPGDVCQNGNSRRGLSLSARPEPAAAKTPSMGTYQSGLTLSRRYKHKCITRQQLPGGSHQTSAQANCERSGFIRSPGQTTFSVLNADIVVLP